MLTIRYIVFLLIFLQTTDCKDSNQVINETPSVMTENDSQPSSQSSIESIVVEHYGGMTSQREVMIVTKSMISYSFKDMNHPKPLIQENDTPDELWFDLNKSFDAKQFSDLKSGTTQVVFDGMDFIFTVKGEFGELKVTNPLDHDIEMKQFFENLKKMVLQYYNATPK